MILVAIPVHERGALVRHCLRTAAELVLPAGGEIMVLDDASPTLDVPALIAETGLRCRYERMPQRLGADAMVRQIWRQFLESGHAHLLFLDSDMVANRDAVTVALQLAGRFDGLLSLYNSLVHPGQAIDDDLVGKPVIGNAGTLWSRELVAMVEAATDPEGWAIDHAYCRVLAERGIPIAVTARSRVQHIGIYGTNNRHFGWLEHGQGFLPDSLAQWQALGFVYDDLMSRQRDFLPPPPRADLVSRLRRLFGGKV